METLQEKCPNEPAKKIFFECKASEFVGGGGSDRPSCLKTPKFGRERICEWTTWVLAWLLLLEIAFRYKRSA